MLRGIGTLMVLALLSCSETPSSDAGQDAPGDAVRDTQKDLPTCDGAVIPLDTRYGPVCPSVNCQVEPTPAECGPACGAGGCWSCNSSGWGWLADTCGLWPG